MGGYLKGCFIILAVSLFYIKTQVSFPVHGDEVFFKAPGLSWVRTGDWNSPEEYNYEGWSPLLHEVFASYPPLYPFFFGCLIKLVGFTWQACAAYDVLIHILLSSVLIFTFRAVHPKAMNVAWLFGILFLLCWYVPRPDRLAMLFGYLSIALVFINKKANKNYIRLTAGAIFGLCVATSVPCGIALTPIVSGLVLCDTQDLLGRCKNLFIFGAAAFLLATLAITPVLIYNWGAIEQNINASKAITSYSFGSGISYLASYHRDTCLAVPLLLAPCLIGTLHWVLKPNLKQSYRWLAWYALALPSMIFFFSKSTFQGNYHWFFIPWLILCLFNGSLHSKWLNALRIPLLIAVLIMPITINLRQLIGSLVTPENRRVEAYEKTVEELIPVNASVLATDYWRILAMRNKVSDILNYAQLNANQIDYIIVTGYGSGAAGRPQPLPPFAEGQYDMIYNDLDKVPPKFLGVPLTNGTYSCAPVIYRRKDLKSLQ
jgi:hypothetical protein